MDERHRRILQKNRVQLLKELEPSLLYDGLIAKGVFTQDMIDEIQSKSVRRDCSRQLLTDLEGRGSQAFHLFLECLREAGQNRVVDILCQRGQIPVPPIIEPLPVIIPNPTPHTWEFKDHLDRGDATIVVKGVSCSQDKTPLPIQCTEDQHLHPKPSRRVRRDSLQSYKMDSNPSGLCLIINNVNFMQESKLKSRAGSDVDSDKMKKRFEALNFKVSVKRNLKAQEIKRSVFDLAKEDHTNFDCCIVIILSHGREAKHSRFPGGIHGIDGLFVTMEALTSYFNGQNCPSLQGKPKVFFVQACGGDEKDTGFDIPADEFSSASNHHSGDDQTDAAPMITSVKELASCDEPDARTSLPNSSDILVSYSTFPGYVSWRDTSTGSWYVETLDAVLEEYAGSEDLVTMLMMVTDKVSQNSAKGIYKQMPGSFNFLRKHLFFKTSASM
ncbi:caspase-9 [Erpetoichthys calabaricus]|uniref:Caspase 9, apoptosis-related cysteine peptidase n=1 Tax=Erpetoichthys calabaricus TaxID=27687 RepID=A0A8C4S963_ERPCA|nr:caspase-9 [Erpetoichthys calabaricus]